MNIWVVSSIWLFQWVQLWTHQPLSPAAHVHLFAGVASACSELMPNYTSYWYSPKVIHQLTLLLVAPESSNCLILLPTLTLSSLKSVFLFYFTHSVERYIKLIYFKPISAFPCTVTLLPCAIFFSTRSQIESQQILLLSKFGKENASD